MSKETLYYDGACPLCNAEINQLKQRASEEIEFQNVHDMDIKPEEAEARLRLLHFETRSGDLLTGLDANVAAWQYTRWGFLFRVLRWPVIRQVADAVYQYWAVKRFDRLYPGGYRRAETSNQLEKT